MVKMNVGKLPFSLLDTRSSPLSAERSARVEGMRPVRSLVDRSR